MTDDATAGVDLSGLHREIDALKVQLCRCRHEGTCMACQGFEVLRQQGQMVAAAASQPVLIQVAQEAAAKDLMTQMSGLGSTLQSKLADDSQLQELMARVIDRIQDDLGGPEEVQKLIDSLGLAGFSGFPGAPGSPGADGTPLDDRSIPPDDRPPRSDA